MEQTNTYIKTKILNVTVKKRRIHERTHFRLAANS